tara:strand:- start:19256 stop:20980 length:1725 start_codon:yes stop_codon:yes gene_type:complete
MSIILGLNCFHADSSACIIKNGQIICAIEEERINRIKHWAGFPLQSIKECLKISNINFNQITDVTINTNPKSNFIPKIKFFLKNLVFGKKKIEIFKRYKNKTGIKKLLQENFKFNKNLRFHYINHHLSHIASGYYLTDFKKAICLTIDGSGDFSSLTISQCNDNEINIIKQIFFPNSLGIFYESMTQFLGFKYYGEEYKVMGLAPYGKPKYFDLLKKNLFKITDNFFELNLLYFNHQRNNFSYSFSNQPNQVQIYNKKFINLINKENDNNINFKKDFAASIQKVYEFYFEKIINYIEKLNYSKNLIFSGGCALNSSANKSLINNIFFENIFIPYSPGDNGGAIGSALFFYNQSKNKKTFLKKNITPYLGTKYNNEQVEEYFKPFISKIDYTFFTNEKLLYEKTVDILLFNGVIGWFQGKMEFGPRALGNRSILADPRNANMKDIINKKIKKRENFRPFAPSILQEEKYNWFEKNSFENLYMSSVENIKKNKSKYIQAVTHVDGTGRVQDISKDINPKFHGLISEFFKRTGVPILLNTSFNENEPIVRTPKEAIDCLLRTDMDALVIENYLIKKK